MTPLEVVGHIDIPESVLRHRFVIEALACTAILATSEDVPGEQVVGTANTKAVELYGWVPNVPAHVDNTGFIYLLALNDGNSKVNVWPNDGLGTMSELMPAGTVIRLNDHKVHWTEDDQARVCAFVGSFKSPSDAEAMRLLQGGVDALARGDYYGAPRVQEGFRALMPDECLVPDERYEVCKPMLLADAQAQGLMHETCAECDKPAIKLDSKWPIYAEYNRCADHLGGSHATD